MNANPFWAEIDAILERHRKYVVEPGEVQATRAAEQAAYEQNLQAIRERVVPWVKELEHRQFAVSEQMVKKDGASVKYCRQGYQGMGGFDSWHDICGNLVAAWVAPGSNWGTLTCHNDPDENTHLGRRFSRGAFESFLKNNLLTYLDDTNLLLTHKSWTQLRRDRFAELRRAFDELKSMPDRRAAGRKFEVVLERLFTLEGLAPRGAFRVVGEQIDGSFVLDSETYLVEAKWEKSPIGNKELYAFREKIEGKSRYTHGVFIAVNGITKGGEDALPRGKDLLFFVVVGQEIERLLAGDSTLGDLLRQRQRLLCDEGAILDREPPGGRVL